MLLPWGSFFFSALTLIWAKEYYYPQPNSSTWDNARLNCQLCYTDLVRITSGNAEFVVQNLTSKLYWTGLRKNFSGSISWAQWCNGDPVTYQNWYPGHPIPKKQTVPALTCPALNVNDSTQSPTLTQLLACLNSNKTNSSLSLATSSPTIFLTTSANCSSTIISDDTDPNAYVDDACVALHNLGMWWENPCSNLLPYICYDVVFYGKIEISNVTYDGAYLRWSQAPGDISYYRVEIQGSSNQTSEETNLTKQIQNLVPGSSELPKLVSNLAIVNVEMHNVTLNWTAPYGGYDSYLVTVSGKPNQISDHENHTVINLDPGVLYNFTVCAVLNNSIYGQAAWINGYTKPSPVKNLTSANNDTTKITVSWDSDDCNSTEYCYHIILYENGINKADYRKQTITLTNLTAGSKYTLSVSALANCSVEGEALNISAYTIPLPVSNLLLNSTANSITANWQNPGGNYSWFKVNIFNSTNIIIPLTTNNTNQSSCIFNSLQAAELYNVTVITYLENFNWVSPTVYRSIFTLPVPPEAVSVISKNTTAVELKWVVPAQSEGVANMKFKVTYSSPFWRNNNGTFNVTGQVTTIIPGLKSGSRYYFSVSIFAGDLESAPTSTNETTVANNRTLTLSVLCSSAITQYCMREDTMSQALNVL
ncbi:receptor-type tyrosine-protein phosphatase eta isoform X2 [Brachyhypopomus gauderio]